MMQQPAAGGVAPPQTMPPMQQSDQTQQYQQATAQQQQQWMMMPPQQQQLPVPPPAGWTPQPVPPPTQQSQVQQQQQQYGAPQSSGEIRSLWIGDLQPWMDENYLVSIFAHTGEVLSTKVIRNKQTGLPEGYGFIEFMTRAAAERILQSYNGAQMPNSEQNFRLNWAALGSGERRQDDGGSDFTIFVGDLAADVTDYTLQETFKAVYSTVKGAKVVTDRLTGRSKGYGFVRFGDENEQLRAMTEMNGQYCSTRPMRIGSAANKKPAGVQQFQKGHQRLSFGGPGTDFS